MRRFLCRFSWIVPAFFLVVGQAYAHAALIESTPADGSVVASAPAEIRLRFNEPVSPVVVRLLDAKGSERRDIHVEARDTIYRDPRPDRSAERRSGLELPGGLIRWTSRRRLDRLFCRQRFGLSAGISS